jgi:hypothetical protein
MSRCHPHGFRITCRLIVIALFTSVALELEGTLLVLWALGLSQPQNLLLRDYGRYRIWLQFFALNWSDLGDDVRTFLVCGLSEAMERGSASVHSHPLIKHVCKPICST